VIGIHVLEIVFWNAYDGMVWPWHLAVSGGSKMYCLQLIYM